MNNAVDLSKDPEFVRLYKAFCEADDRACAIFEDRTKSSYEIGAVRSASTRKFRVVRNYALQQGASDNEFIAAGNKVQAGHSAQRDSMDNASKIFRLASGVMCGDAKYGTRKNVASPAHIAEENASGKCLDCGKTAEVKSIAIEKGKTAKLCRTCWEQETGMPWGKAAREEEFGRMIKENASASAKKEAADLRRTAEGLRRSAAADRMQGDATQSRASAKRYEKLADEMDAQADKLLENATPAFDRHKKHIMETGHDPFRSGNDCEDCAAYRRYYGRLSNASKVVLGKYDTMGAR